MVDSKTINISRAVLSVVTLISVAFGLAIFGMAYDIKRATPAEAVQVVLYILGILVVISMVLAILTMASKMVLLKAYGITTAVTLLASVIVVICVKLREDDVLNSVAKLPDPADPTAAAVSADRIELREKTKEALGWGVPIIIVSCILQAGVFVLVAVTWYLASNAGTPEERRARAEAEKNRRVAKIGADVQMSARQNLYKAEQRDNEVLRAHMEKSYGAHTHGDAWKPATPKKRFYFF